MAHFQFGTDGQSSGGGGAGGNNGGGWLGFLALACRHSNQASLHKIQHSHSRIASKGIST